jgi:selenide,water dikinase
MTTPRRELDLSWGTHYGCGRKVRPTRLAEIGATVSGLRNSSLPQVEGLHLLGDSGLSRLGDQLVVQTVDLILPLPLAADVWGRAAALHCLSDCYAVGGTPITAVGVLEVETRDEVDKRTIRAYEAAASELNRSGVALVGGHSILSNISKIGFMITGLGRSESLRTVAKAAPGDSVFVTKRVGSGAAFAHATMTGERPAELDEIVAEMLVSNEAASAAAMDAGLRCSTDVSGFGLLGALLQVAAASNVTIDIATEAVPVFPSGRTAVRSGAVPSIAEDVWMESAQLVKGEVSIETSLVLADPQINGGLVLFAPAASLSNLRAAADRRGVALTKIGTVRHREAFPINLE